jgi:DNA repair protein RecO (recombination protein O)
VSGTPQTESSAILLRGVDFGDADRVCTFLTDSHGKLSAFAKGVRGSKRRYRGGLGLFTRMTIQWVDKGADKLASLRGSEVETAWHTIAGDLDRMAIGCLALDVLEGVLQSGQGGGPVFATSVRFFDWLHRDAGGVARFEAGGQRFQLLLLNDAGLLPPLDACVRSGEAFGEDDSAVWLPEVGLVAPSARHTGERGTPLDAAALRYLAAVAAGRFPTTDARASRSALRAALHDVWRVTFGRELRSWAFYETTLGAG